MSVDGVWIFLFHEAQEPVGGLLLARESNSGENCGPEPWVATLGKRGAEQLEGLSVWVCAIAMAASPAASSSA